MEKVEAVVIGAGVIGLAVARSLAVSLGKEVMIVERSHTFGTETSSRNSEVVHGGLYYPTNSLKATTCVPGRQLLYEYCEQRHIECDKIGKLVVATDPSQLPTLKALLEQGRRNGYPTLSLLTPETVQTMEPNLTTTCGALWSPETGLVDSHTFMLHLLGDAQERGAVAVYKTAVSDIVPRNNRIDLRVTEETTTATTTADSWWLSCQTLVNCAGLGAADLAAHCHSPQNTTTTTSTTTTDWTPPKHYFAKGNYFRLQHSAGPLPFHHLIYPVPDDTRGGLGVHATIDTRNRQVKFGPNVEWLDPTTGVFSSTQQLDYTPTTSPRVEQEFYQSIRSYWPDLPDGALVADYAGIRPKLWHPHYMHNNNNNKHSKPPFYDFILAGPQQHGIQGLFHLLGIESPGLTSSLALADLVARQVAAEGGSQSC